MRILALGMLLGLAACGGADDGNEEPEGAFDELRGTVERAGGVEDELEDARQRLDEALEESDPAADDERP